MTALSSTAKTPGSPNPDTGLETIAFHLDYVAAKLTAISEGYVEEVHGDLAHDLHSAWDAVCLARVALRKVCAAQAFPGLPQGTDFAALLDEFTARWDRANEPIGWLRAEKTSWAAAEWAAARARYEAAIGEVVRPVPVDPEERLTRLRETEAELDRACTALRSDEPEPTPAVPEQRRRRRASA